jgi:predicted amidohydrolase
VSTLVVAAVQMQSGLDREHNLSTAERLVDQAVGRGAKLVALPEHFGCGGPARLQREGAEPIPGPTIERLRRKAAAAGIYLVAGSLAERVPDSDRSFNTSVLIDPRGEIVAAYRKVHLFDVELSGQPFVRESEYFLAGDSIVAACTEWGPVGLTICYDLRFPELYRALALSGAGIIFVVSSFLAWTGRDHWEPLLRARAIENQVFLVAPDQAGPIPGTDTLRHGHSAIVDPWGTVLAQASDGEGVVTAELDLDRLAELRRQLPCLGARRTDVYGMDLGGRGR